ncbi:MAG: hypothetical protein ACI8W8_002254 [Rhodothermales bacterium]|jgi:hypothetical protein
MARKKRNDETVFQAKTPSLASDGGVGTVNNPSDSEQLDDMSNTMRLSRKKIIGDISVEHRAYLEVHGLSDDPKRVDLGDEEVTIGRSPETTIQVTLNNVSRIHTRIFSQGDEYFVEDLESTNGTYLNNIRIVKSVLRNNDQVEIGECKMVFVEERMRKS